MRLPALRLLCAAGLVLAAASVSGLSSAAFTSKSAATAGVTAAADWTPPTVSVSSPGTVRGTTTVTATAADQHSAVASVTIQRSPDGTTWTTLCTRTAAPYGCSWDTTAVPDGTHRLRAVAVDGHGNSAGSAAVTAVVDNSAPSVSLGAPAGPWTGTVRLTATADDTTSGVADVRFQYAATGSSTWTTICTVAAAPYTCDWQTATVVDGGYSVRAVATDRAGNATTTPAQQRTVSNTVASVSVSSPGSPVSGTVTVPAEASSSNGVKSVVVRWAPVGTSTWTVLCTDTTAPYSCPWNTVAATSGSGSFDLQAVLTDNHDLVLTSERVTVVVDNTALRGHDVQTVNTAVAGKVDPGDQLVLTWSTVVDPATVVAGWNGTGSRVVTVSLNQNGTSDTLSFTGANLGSVALGRNFTDRTLTFPSTLTHSVSTAGGVSRSVLTVTFGTPSDPTALRTVTSNGTMVWAPSSAVRTASGVVAATTNTNETGTADRDF